MTSLYLIRHCEAQGNAKKIFQGRTDLDITETGRRQLEFLSERFKNIPLDAVYSSPLIRAVKTAHAVADPQGLPVLIKAGLSELDGGIIDGKPTAETFGRDPVLFDTWQNSPQNFAPEGGEPMRAAYERIYKAVSEIIEENEGKTIAAATHGGVLRCLMCRVLFGDIERLREAPLFLNTAVALLEFEGKNCAVRLLNDAAHLPKELLSVLPKELAAEKNK